MLLPPPWKNVHQFAEGMIYRNTYEQRPAKINVVEFPNLLFFSFQCSIVLVAGIITKVLLM